MEKIDNIISNIPITVDNLKKLKEHLSVLITECEEQNLLAQIEEIRHILDLNLEAFKIEIDGHNENFTKSEINKIIEERSKYFMLCVHGLDKVDTRLKKKFNKFNKFYKVK